MTRELHRIEPRSIIRIGFFMGLLCGFLFGLYISFVLDNLSGLMLSPEEAEAFQALRGTMLVTAVLTALMGSLFFSLIGGMLAWFYNFIAGRFGGIEYTVVDSSSSDPRQLQESDSPEDE